jgi:probable F420-dependent oxidoreductase
MELGVLFHLGGPCADPGFVAAIGPAMEERGFNTVWVTEHAVLFDETNSRYPYTEDGVPPFSDSALNFLEPFTALTFIASTTKKLRLATGVCLLPQRNPVYTAKHAADLDLLSGGRFDFGIGVGWLKEEFDALNVPWERRGARADEYIEIAKLLWSDGPSEFAGEFYNLPSCHLYPKPVQTPHPPIIAGGDTNMALRRVAKYCDGWFGVENQPDDVGNAIEN